MRYVFFIVGVAAVAVAGWLLLEAVKCKPDFWCHSLGGAATAAAAGLVLTAGIKRYRGHWPFLIGTLLLAIGFAGFGTDIDTYLANPSSDEVATGVFWSLLFWTFGVLLVFSGHKLHRCIAELEVSRKAERAAQKRDAKPGASPNTGSVSTPPPSLS